jgi:predicted alpha/beta hydrolase family esterase
VSGPRVLILPGYQNSGPGHWQSLWQAQRPEYRRVMQRDWENTRRAEWVAGLEAAVRTEPGPVVLVAHSLGCVTVAHWVAAHRHAVAGALLVAPPDVEHDWAADAVRDFGPIPLAPLPFPSIVVASTSDPYSEIARAESWARAWGSRFVSLGDAGHINADAGYGAWPEGLALLDELVAGPPPATPS